MALETQESLLATLQQEVVHTSVGAVASNATLHSYRGVFENERPALLNMAFDAGLPMRLGQLEMVQVAVRIVAVRALHETLRDPVMFRQRKLRLDGAMTTEAKVRLSLLEQTLVEPAIIFGQLRHREECRLRRGQLHALPLRRPFQ